MEEMGSGCWVSTGLSRILRERILAISVELVIGLQNPTLCLQKKILQVPHLDEPHSKTKLRRHIALRFQINASHKIRNCQSSRHMYYRSLDLGSIYLAIFFTTHFQFNWIYTCYNICLFNESQTEFLFADHLTLKFDFKNPIWNECMTLRAQLGFIEFEKWVLHH